jgi:hypothetical protein
MNAPLINLYRQAEGFYLKSGYEPMGEIKKYWREHSRIFLRKAL